MSTRKSALGKGLGALLDTPSTPAGNDAAPVTGGSNFLAGMVAQVPLSQIEGNPFQPRTEFDETALKELSESILTQGIIQPITVRKMGHDRYQIISGERRFKASRMAGLEAIPAYIRVANDQAMLEMALVENIQRENLNALEIAISYQRLIEECSMTQEQLGEHVGKDRSTITNYLRLLKLPPQIQYAIRDGRLTMGHARAILGVDDVGVQLKLLNDILQNDLSVCKAEELVRAAAPRKASKKDKNGAYAAELDALQERLCRRFETKVHVKNKANNSGQIVFNYYSIDDLNRLVELMDYD